MEEEKRKLALEKRPRPAAKGKVIYLPQQEGSKIKGPRPMPTEEQVAAHARAGCAHEEEEEEKEKE